MCLLRMMCFAARRAYGAGLTPASSCRRARGRRNDVELASSPKLADRMLIGAFGRYFASAINWLMIAKTQKSLDFSSIEVLVGFVFDKSIFWLVTASQSSAADRGHLVTME